MNGRPQPAQTFSGRCCFLTPRMTDALRACGPFRCRTHNRAVTGHTPADVLIY
jgi:hypothetical protein